MGYILKHFDIPLMAFTITSGGIKGGSVELVQLNEEYKAFFPLDLDLTDKGLLEWLRRRVIPRNRAFVQSFLAKLGLNVSDTKGIIDLCRTLSAGVVPKTGQAQSKHVRGKPENLEPAFPRMC